MLPFAREQFVAVFDAYNHAVWPAQVLAYVLGLAMVAALLRPTPVRDRWVVAGLALMWAWTGIAYHGLFFSAINTAAPGFAVLFVVQAALFARLAASGASMRFSPHPGARGWLGWALVVYASLLYPVIGMATGHGWPAMPMFGITPCPVTLFTFGLLLLAEPPVPRRLLVIPLLWSLVGGSAAFLLAVPQDWPLLIGGLAVIPPLWRRAVAEQPRGPQREQAAAAGRPLG